MRTGPRSSARASLDSGGRSLPNQMPRILERSSAQRDLLEHFVYLGEKAGEAVARRFLTSAKTTFQELAEMPRMGVFPQVPKPKIRERPDVAGKGVREIPCLLSAIEGRDRGAPCHSRRERH